MPFTLIQNERRFQVISKIMSHYLGIFSNFGELIFFFFWYWPSCTFTKKSVVVVLIFVEIS